MSLFRRKPAVERSYVVRAPSRAIRHVHLIDTAVASDNIGDEIIVEAIRNALLPIFEDCYVSTSSGHDGLGPFGRELAAQADIAILMGANSLSPRDQSKRRFVWAVQEEDERLLAGKVLLCGVGANRAFDVVEPAQIRFLKRVLSGLWTHSVRDSLGSQILSACGLASVNTSCPTLWRYAERQPVVPAKKADAVCFTLTKHKADPADLALVETLRRSYTRLYFWPQQPRDLDYLRELTALSDVVVIPSNLRAYDRFLAETPVDVVGTRLHGGIRALSHGRRVLVVAIDNRATEIGRETGLPVIDRTDVPVDLSARVESAFPTRLTLPVAEIRAYLDQFRAGGAAASTT